MYEFRRSAWYYETLQYLFEKFRIVILEKYTLILVEKLESAFNIIHG